MTEQPGQDRDLCAQCGNQFPAGQACQQCAAPEPPDLESALRASLGIQDLGSSIRSIAQVHADWRQAWADTGKFTDQETFELIRVMVASMTGGARCLNL